ncbi:MAG TPA: hypothetical protein ENI86_11195 [Acidimicrobiales bacterium]|nr:hypothetical protein [Acidimicrobiales bacterium]
MITDHHIHNHHRDVQGGVERAAVFGASDGLVSNVLLILGVAGADSSQGIVRITGLVGLLAGAISMAAGEYVSVKAQNDLVEREIQREREAHASDPEEEIEELAELYMDRGVPEEHAQAVARALMSDPETALAVHTREELGFYPDELASPIKAALFSLVAFSLGALVPLLPWFFGGGDGAIIASLILGVLGAATVGLILAVQTAGSKLRLMARQVGIAIGAGAVTYGIGALVGVQVG